MANSNPSEHMGPRSLRQYVTFDLMGEEYALAIEHVREIIECEKVTSIPAMPPVVRGLMNLRGNVIAIVDLAIKFGLPETALGRGTYIVVVDLVWNAEAVRLGLLTRELGRVVDAVEDQIKPVPDFGTRIQAEYLRGIAQIDGRPTLFLNVEHLLAASEILRLTAATGTSARGSAAPEAALGGPDGEP
jgi:purine-binding chemotaxis protein CheW